MSNALRFMQCLPFGKQLTAYQPPTFKSRVGSGLVSLFTAASVILGSLLGFPAVAAADDDDVDEILDTSVST